VFEGVKYMPKIVNIVASQRIAQSLDINEIAYVLNIDYEQEQFPGMVYRTQEPKVCILLFRSGKAVATGAKDLADIETAFDRLRKDLELNEFELYDEELCETALHNLVVTADYSKLIGDTKLNLSKLMLYLPFDKTEYEPEQFPGLIYRAENPKVVFLIFSSGKCVITGSKDYEEAVEAENMFKDELSAIPF
tara:strand:- start:342 stop:917 length:576 start_codon:yes stop_codon:yes gene_type:complete